MHRGFRAGALRATPDGLSFAYDPRWVASAGAFTLSLTMPLGERVWTNETVGPWVANLLPEEDMLRAFAGALGVSSGDAFALLARAGADTAGAFSFAPDGEAATSIAAHLAIEDYVGAKDGAKGVPGDAGSAMEALIDGLARRPFFADAEGVRLSLAGGQVKTTLTGLDASGWPTASLTPARFVAPVGEAASTVILKPENPRLLGIVEIEAYGLELARRVGLETAPWRILRAGSRSALLVGRYDREIVPRGGRVEDPARAVRRVHQEDFCQLLGLEPRRKYEQATGGGASMADLFAAARRWLPPRELLRLRVEVYI
jgi:serine/threonine-protein kinase HipA